MKIALQHNSVMIEPDFDAAEGRRNLLRYAVPVGRLLYVLIFLMSSLGHFSPQVIGYAAQQGVPMAGLLVPFSGLIALAGGLSILFGYRARIGAGLLVLFLVPVTLTMHRFWGVADPMMAQIQQAMFMKNLSMLGGALLIAYFGAGPFSLDARFESHSDKSGSSLHNGGLSPSSSRDSHQQPWRHV
jgi:putative oxidoreductase